MTIRFTHRNPGGGEGFAGIPRYINEHLRVFPDVESVIVPDEPGGTLAKIPYLWRRYQDGLGPTHALGVGDALGIPKIVTVHDLYTWTLRREFKEWGAGWRYAFYWRLQAHNALKAEHRVAFSPEAAADLERCGSSATTTILPTTPPLFRGGRPDQTKREGFLTVGDNSPRKGHHWAYAAAHLLARSILWIGTEWEFLPHSNYTKYLRDQWRASAQRVSDSRLLHEYRTREALIVGSYAEGWCYPVMEALSQDCPVIHYNPDKGSEDWFKSCWPGLPVAKTLDEVEANLGYDAYGEYERLSDKFGFEDDGRYREGYQRLYDASEN